MNEVVVTGLTRIRAAKPNKGGSTVIAYFDCEARGLEFIGCAFVRTPKNGLTVWLPKIETPQPGRRAVNFTDCSLRHAMMLQARETYRALGGTDAEWIGRSIPMGPRGGEDDDLAPEHSSQEDADDDGIWLPPPRRAIGVKRTVVPVIGRQSADEGEDREGLAIFLGSKDNE